MNHPPKKKICIYREKERERKQVWQNVKVKVKSLGRVRLFATPWTVAYKAPLSMEFSRQEYWRGLPFPTPEDLPNSGGEPISLASSSLAGRFFTTALPGEAALISPIANQFLFIVPQYWNCSLSSIPPGPTPSRLLSR